MVPKCLSQSKTSTPVNQSWVENLSKTTQTDIASSPVRKHVTCGCSSHPKVQLRKFDGDHLQWPDWSSMFKSVVHDADLSLNGKMQHLQHYVVGRTKSAIEGYGYSGDSYYSMYEALKEWKARLGKPSLVVKVTLDRLRETSNYDRPHEVRNLSEVVSTTVWIFKWFGYKNDLAAKANISISVAKLFPDLQVKWKDHVRTRLL